MTIKIESEDDGSTVTALTGKVDQAALQDLLRWLYSLGLPLISVTWVGDVKRAAAHYHERKSKADSYFTGDK